MFSQMEGNPIFISNQKKMQGREHLANLSSIQASIFSPERTSEATPEHWAKNIPWSPSVWP